MRIVVVDDSEQRVGLIKSSLEKTYFYKYLEIIYCDSADAGRRALIAKCDLLLLDVLIPKKKNGTPQAKHSISLLADVCSSAKSYIRPRLIIGLTAAIDELGDYQLEFAREATVVLSGTLQDVAWIDRLVQQIESLLGSDKKVSQRTNDRLLISVHGIRTYGHWQSKISEEIAQHSRSFECVEIKYGFFDLLSFLMAKKRDVAIEKVAQRVKTIINENKSREIFVIAHSFGSLVAARALSSFAPEKVVKMTFFCGSPMSHTDDIDNVINASEITINDCGIHDIVLLAARFFGMGLGDAGRVGFERENSSKFRNRYFVGGHGLYFGKYKKYGLFYERFWLSPMISGVKPISFDARKDYIGQDVVYWFVLFLTKTKPYSATLILILIFYGIYNLISK